MARIPIHHFAPLLVLSLFLASCSNTHSALANDASQKAYERWNQSQLKQWLEDHNLPVPAREPASHEKLLGLVQSSWDNVYDSWSDSDLRSWLKQHGILAAPKSTRSELLEYAQEVVYAARDNVQGAFESASESAIESWNDSQLREFLLQHGIVAPHSGREQLLVLAQRKQREIQTAAAKMYEEASKSISSAYGDATVLASDAYVTASRSAHSKAAEAVKNGRKSVARLEDSMSDASDFVYSTWEDNRIRDFLVEKGVIKSDTQATRDHLLKQMRETYKGVVDHVWDAWSDSFIRKWLVYHGVIKTKFQANRDEMLRIMRENYYAAGDKVWDAWTDSQIRDFLVDHGMVKADRKYRRHQLDRIMNRSYRNIVAGKDQARGQIAAYLDWSDARIKGWLREHDVEPPKKRDELLKTMHQEYVSARSTSQNSLSGLYTSLRSFLLNAREIAEDRLYALYALAQGAGAETEGGSEKVKAKVEKATERAKKEL